MKLTDIIPQISGFFNIFPLYEQVDPNVAASRHSRKLVRAHNLQYSEKDEKTKHNAVLEASIVFYESVITSRCILDD